MYVVARADVCNPALGHTIGQVCFIAEPTAENNARIVLHEYIGRKIEGISLDQTETGVSIFRLQEVRGRDGKLVCFFQIVAVMRCNSMEEAEEMFYKMVGLNHKTSAN